MCIDVGVLHKRGHTIYELSSEPYTRRRSVCVHMYLDRWFTAAAPSLSDRPNNVHIRKPKNFEYLRDDVLSAMCTQRSALALSARSRIGHVKDHFYIVEYIGGVEAVLSLR